MSESELIVLLGGAGAGRVIQDRHGRLKFIYADSWRRSPAGYPLSLSMPLQATEHGHSRIEPFLRGLLPDNSSILERWAVRFQVSPRNAFALIANVGEDCAGAVQFVRPERIDALERANRGSVHWVSEANVAARLRALRSDPGAWRSPQDNGQFSLAGAQPKTALLLDRGRWGVPSGRTPTTHILKPPSGAFEGLPENEHFCLELARALGLPAADSKIVRFDEEVAIVVERYDRVHSAEGWIRVHQEDMCQALSVPPEKKYQNEGGPGPREIVDLLRAHSSSPDDDVGTFAAALGFSWLIAATDAHGKNFGVLLASNGRTRLAPLYDIASILPYDRFDTQRVKLAMRVGGKYRLNEIGRRQWEKAAGEIRMDFDELEAKLVHMAQEIPDLATDIARRSTSAGLGKEVIDRLCTKLIGRSRVCVRILQGRRAVSD